MANSPAIGSPHFRCAQSEILGARVLTPAAPSGRQ